MEPTPALGARVRLLRLGRGMTLDELASAAGGVVTKQALSKYERGLMRPSPRVLVALARALGVRTSELLAAPRFDIEILAFRRQSRLPQKERQRVESLVSRMLEARVRLQQVSGQGNGLHLALGQYKPSSLEDCEAIAAKVREAWLLGSDPISCVTDVLEKHHIHVFHMQTAAAFDGLAAVARDDSGTVRAAAVVSREGVAGERQRLNLAHELGHLVMQESVGVDHEKAAFRFGAAFLAPRELVWEDTGRARRQVSLGELLLLKKRYGMSVQALVYRLHDLGIIGDNQAAALWRQISARGWRTEEPGALEPERPQWAHRAALRAIAEGALTVAEAEDMLGERTEGAPRPETADRRATMRLPMRERARRLRTDAARARADYVENQEWISLLGGDLLPDE